VSEQDVKMTPRKGVSFQRRAPRSLAKWGWVDYLKLSERRLYDVCLTVRKLARCCRSRATALLLPILHLDSRQMALTGSLLLKINRRKADACSRRNPIT